MGFLLLVFAASLSAPELLRLDEPGHAALAVQFAESPSWDSIRSYEGARKFEAKGPFVFALGALWGSVFGMTLLNLRLLSLAFGVLALVAARVLVDEAAEGEGPAADTPLVVLPYFLFLSVLFHTDVPTLALALCALVGYARNVEALRPMSWLGAVLATSAMLWTRIDSVVLPAAFGLACLWPLAPLPRTGRELRVWVARLPPRLWIGLLLPAVSVVPLVVAWGGLLPPSARGRPVPVALELTPSNLSFGLCVVGLYFAPFALRGLDRTRSMWIAIASGLALFAAFPVSFAGADDRFLGLLRSASLAVGPPRWMLALGLATLCVAGALALRTILAGAGREGVRVRALAASVVLTLAAQALRGPVIYERYLLPTTALLLLLSFRLPVGWRSAWLAALGLLSVTQLFWKRLIVLGG